MKTLLLMRHAKSSWSADGVPDHDRPLNERGKRDAPRMGELLASHDLRPDLIVSSTAKRARKTAAKVAEATGYDGKVEERSDLYMASTGTWLAMISSLSDDCRCVLAVGHNPTMELLVERLGGTRQSMPTAAVAHFELDAAAWGALCPGANVVLREVYRPKGQGD